MSPITVYTQSGCVASQVWVEMLRGAGIEFVQRRIGTDSLAADELRAAGPLATPTTVAAGQRFSGLSPAHLAAIIAQSAEARPSEEEQR